MLLFMQHNLVSPAILIYDAVLNNTVKINKF